MTNDEPKRSAETAADSEYSDASLHAFRQNMAKEFARLSESCALKRAELLQIAEQMATRRRRLLIFSGLLALSASSAFAGLMDSMFSASAMKAIGSIFSLTSGVVTLMTSVSMKEVEISGVYGTANNYLILRERTADLVNTSDLSVTQIKKRFAESRAEYVRLDDASSKWLYGNLMRGNADIERYMTPARSASFKSAFWPWKRRSRSLLGQRAPDYYALGSPLEMPYYPELIPKPIAGVFDPGEVADDQLELFWRCVALIQNERAASTSLLQIRLSLGYTSASFMLQLLEKKGFIGPQVEGKPREVLRFPDGTPAA